MRFVSVRELRTKSAEVWRRLANDGEVVITSNGKPIAILSPVDEASLERQIAATRRVRAALALDELHRQAAEAGLDRLADAEIDAERRAVRRARQGQ